MIHPSNGPRMFHDSPTVFHDSPTVFHDSPECSLANYVTKYPHSLFARGPRLSLGASEMVDFFLSPLSVPFDNREARFAPVARGLPPLRIPLPVVPTAAAAAAGGSPKRFSPGRFTTEHAGPGVPLVRLWGGQEKPRGFKR